MLQIHFYARVLFDMLLLSFVGGAAKSAGKRGEMSDEEERAESRKQVWKNEALRQPLKDGVQAALQACGWCRIAGE